MVKIKGAQRDEQNACTYASELSWAKGFFCPFRDEYKTGKIAQNYLLVCFEIVT